MAIAFVNGSRGGNTASASSIATTAQSLTAGNLTVIAYYMDSPTVTPSGVPTDTAGNTYIQVGATQTQTPSGGNYAMFYAFNCLGNASNIVTVNLSASIGYRAWDRWQFSGVPTTNPYIINQFGTAASGTAMSTAAVSHGSGSAVITCFGGQFSTSGVTAGGSGYTFTAFAITGDVTTYFGDQYKVVSADDTPTMTGSQSLSWALFAASFGTPPTIRRLSLLGAGN